MMDEQKTGKVMAVDWGSKRIGLAVSDETRTLARPLTVIQHTSRADDAQRIVEMGEEERVNNVIIGVTYSGENELSPSGRSAQRLAAEIEARSSFKVILWDEEFTTRDGKDASIEAGTSRSKRRGHMDDRAAALLLQSYLDSEAK